MQDSPCDSDIDCTLTKFKISYECWDFFPQFSFFSNFGMFFEHLRIQIRDIFFSNFFILEINKNWLINETAIRAPPAVTRLTVHRRYLSSSKSGAWQSNGSDFSKSDHYYCVTWIFLKVSHDFEASSLILSLWEAVVSDFDHRVVLEKWNFDFWHSFWSFKKF